MKATSLRQKKRKYVPNIAAKKFKPTSSWLLKDARGLFKTASFPMDVDYVSFDDCVSGMRTLPENCIDMIIADPPFGLDFQIMEALYNRDSNHVVTGYTDVPAVDYDVFSDRWIKEIKRIMKKEAGVWIFSGWTNLKDILNALEKNKLTLINHIIWKYQFGVFTKKKFVTSHYHVLFAVKDPNRYFFNKIEHYPEDVWDIKRKYHHGMRKNATKLPINVVMRCIDFGSKPGDIILDPFMGNGTTAMVCKGTFRHFLGFEINAALTSTIKWNIDQVKEGEFYIPYSRRTPELVESRIASFRKKIKKTLQTMKNKEKN